MMPPNEGFYAATVAPDAVQAGALVEQFLGGKKLLLSRVDGEIVAFTNRCPHAGANFIEGEISRHKLFCPTHGYCFDVRNGRILYPADEAYHLKRYDVLVEADQIWVKVD